MINAELNGIIMLASSLISQLVKSDSKGHLISSQVFDFTILRYTSI